MTTVHTTAGVGVWTETGGAKGVLSYESSQNVSFLNTLLTTRTFGGVMTDDWRTVWLFQVGMSRMIPSFLLSSLSSSS